MYITETFSSTFKNRTSDGSSVTPQTETSVLGRPDPLDGLAFKKAVRVLGGANVSWQV